MNKFLIKLGLMLAMGFFLCFPLGSKAGEVAPIKIPKNDLLPEGLTEPATNAEPITLIPAIDETAPPLEEIAPPVALKEELKEEEVITEPATEELLPTVNLVGLIEPTEPPWVGDEALWQNSKGIFPAALLVESPVRKPKGPLGKLEVTLLLQASPPPPQLNLEAFLALRLKRLLAMNKTKEVQQMLEQVPDLTRNSVALSRLKATAALMEYDTPSACDVASQKTDQSELFWLKLNLICNMLEGDEQQANLTYELLTERFGNEVTLINYLNLAAVLLGHKNKKGITIESVTDFTELALLRILELPPSDVIYRSDTVAASLFSNPMASNLVRFKNGFEAAAAGTLDEEEFFEFLYTLQAPSKSAEVSLDVKTTAGKMELMRRLINQQATEKEAVTIIENETEPLKALLVLAILKQTKQLEPKDQTLRALLARLYYLNGDYQEAEALESKDDAMLTSWRYLFTDGTTPVGDWLRTTIINSTDTATTIKGLSLFYASAEALGRSLEAVEWWPVMAKVKNILITENNDNVPPSPDSILWLVPEKAESFGVRLAASLALPSRDFPNRFAPLTIGHTAHYWRSWGLEAEAEELIRHSLYASGI